MEKWNKNSWRKYPISQQPIYENIELVKKLKMKLINYLHWSLQMK